MIFPNPIRYVKTQEKCVRLFGSINKGARILECDARDGAKYLYYLPFGAAVTQWLNADEVNKERGPVNIAAQKLGLTVDFVKENENKIPLLEPSNFDAAISVGAVKRAHDPIVFVDTVLKSLRPDGKFYLVEPGVSDVESLLAATLDDSPLVAQCDVSIEDDIIICVVTRAPYSHLDQRKTTKSTGATEKAAAPPGFGSLSSSSSNKKKKKKTNIR